jgi:hypothetical protein
MKKVDGALEIQHRIKSKELQYQFRCYNSTLNWTPNRVIKHLDRDTLEFDPQCEIILEILQKFHYPYNRGWKLYEMDLKAGTHVMQECFSNASKFKTQQLDSIPNDEWRQFEKKHNIKWNLSRTVEREYSGAGIEMSARFGIPACCLRFAEYPYRTDVSLCGKVILIEAYVAIYNAYPYDWDTMFTLMEKVNFAHDLSFRPFLHKELKVDYQLVILRNYRQFSRLNETAHIDYTKRFLPHFWFDSMDFTDTPLDELMDKLAIEEKWQSTPVEDRYIVTFGFPAGAMFLCTTTVKQETKNGGGIEYIYLHNLDKNSIKEVAQRQCKNLVELDIRFSGLCLQ